MFLVYKNEFFVLPFMSYDWIKFGSIDYINQFMNSIVSFIVCFGLFSYLFTYLLLRHGLSAQT